MWILATSWLHPGYILATSWLHPGYILARATQDLTRKQPSCTHAAKQTPVTITLPPASAKKGLVKAETPAAAKAKKIYNMTRTGRKTLVDQTLAALSTVRPTYSSLLTGMIHWSVLTRDQALDTLRTRLQAVANELERLANIQFEQQPLPDHIDAIMGKHFVEPPLECLCWADKWTDFAERNKDQWKWRVMIVFVDWITQEQFEEAVGKVTLKRGPAPPTLRLMNLHEGKSVQILHVGDYNGIGAVCEKLYREYLPANRLQPNGCYHEIYLNDPARTAPAKRKIVIRQPVK